MTARQRLVPLGICFAIAVGVTSYTFIPIFEKQKDEIAARKKARKDLWNTRYDDPAQTSDVDAAAASAVDIRRKTEERVANAGGATTIPKDTPRWSEAQAGQYPRYTKGFEWSQVPLDQYSDKGNGQDEFGKK